MYPALSGLTVGEPLYTLFAGTMFESPIHITFLGIPVILMNYASSVIPIILAAYFGARVEQSLKKVIPDVVKTFVLPFLTLLIVVPVTFSLLGQSRRGQGSFRTGDALGLSCKPVSSGCFTWCFLASACYIRSSLGRCSDWL